MSDKLRILITGFGPFPGAPFNPTQPLVARLLRLRRPAFGDVELSGHNVVTALRARVSIRTKGVRVARPNIRSACGRLRASRSGNW